MRWDTWDLDRLDLELVDTNRGVFDRARLHREHDLSQRRECLGAHRIQRVDDGLERNVRVGEGIEVGHPNPVEQIDERLGEVDLAAQDESVDEHPDERIEHCVSAPGNRRRDGDVGASRQAREQYRQRGVDNHERGDATFGRCRSDSIRDLRGNGHLHASTAMSGDARAWTVRRQIDDVGEACELRDPVRELSPDHRLGICGIAEDLVLPDRVVGELHCQRDEFGRRVRRTCEIRRDQISHERTHRLTVRRDVMGDEGNDVLVGSHRCHAHPQRQ